MNLSDSQLKLLLRLVDEGPVSPKGNDWAVFYSLERKRLARKVDMLIYVTDAGRLLIRQMEERHG